MGHVLKRWTGIVRWWRGLSAVSGARLWLGVAAIVLVGVLIFCGKPWEVVHEEGRQLSIRDYVHLWFWPTAAVNLVLVGALAWLAPWWTSGVRRTPGHLFPARSCSFFWPGLIAAAVALCVIGWPRMGQSAWHDEANRIKNTMVGSYRILDDDSARWRPVPWVNTAFSSRLPSHILQTIASRASHDVWLIFARPEGYPLSETALRLPCLVAAVGCLFAVGLLLRAMGLPWAGVMAAWLLVLHPWFLRYATEARGYSMAMAFIPAALLFLLRALETGRARWWVAFALAQFAMVYAYIATLWVLVVLNAAALFVIIALRDRGLDTWRATRHWLVANILAGAAFMQMVLPTVPQLYEYFNSEKGAGGANRMDLGWVQNTLAHFLSGIPWTYTGQAVSEYPELFPWAVAHPALAAGIALGALAFLTLGLRRFWVLGPFGILVVLVTLLPAVITFVDAKSTEKYLFEWYVIFALPGLCMAFAAGFTGLVPAGAPRWHGLAVGAAALALLGAYAGWTQPQRAFLTSQSLQPYREAVLLTRPSLDPNHSANPKILTATFHAGPLVYDARIRIFRTLEEFHALLHEAETEQKALFISLAFPVSSRLSNPECYAFMTSSGLFEERAYLPGISPDMGMRIFGYIPGSWKGPPQ